MADPSGLNPRSLGFRGGEILGISFFVCPAFAFKTIFVLSGILEKKKLGASWDVNRYKCFPAEYDLETPRGQGRREGSGWLNPRPLGFNPHGGD